MPPRERTRPVPIATRRIKIDKDAAYLCWQSGSAMLPSGEEISFRAGLRLRGDSPAVQAFPYYFVRDDGAEVPSPFSAVVERHERDQEPEPERDAVLVAEPEPIEPEA